jgi:glycopeptide antibiotics resistance protein
MGKRLVHVVVVRKPVTIALLALITAAMASFVYALSGHAYAADSHALDLMVAHWFGWQESSLSRGTVLAFLMPVIGNMLLFVPWGFLAFLSIDAPGRRRVRSYLATLVLAFVFALTMYVWQEYLPTRVTAISDIVANGLGALGGAALGHARKTVRVTFDF